MMHFDRVWYITKVETAEELARMLVEQTWCRCNAFCINGYPNYAWLNDSFCPDTAQEYAVIKLDDSDSKAMQLESITFSWCDLHQALLHIQKTLEGRDDNNSFARKVHVTLQTPEEHGRCSHCA